MPFKTEEVTYKPGIRNYFLCTREDPWSPSKGTPVQHDRVVEVGDQRRGWPCGDTVRYKCLNCGFEWVAELPQ